MFEVAKGKLHSILRHEVSQPSKPRVSDFGTILERIAGFDPSLEMIAPRYLKFSTASILWSFILISLWKPFGLFVIIFVLSGPISILYLVMVVSRRSTRTPASSSSSAFTTFVICKAEVGDKSSPVADTTFMVIQCLTHDSLQEDVKEGFSYYQFQYRGNAWQNLWGQNGHEGSCKSLCVNKLIHLMEYQARGIKKVVLAARFHCPHSRGWRAVIF